MQSPAKQQESVSERDQGVSTELWRRGWPKTKREFEEMVDAFQHQLVGYAFRRLGSIQDAEDLVQGLFVNVYAGLGKRRGVSSIGGYLYRMAANACTDALRKRRRRRGTRLEEVGVEHIVDNRHDASQTAQAVEELRRIEALLSTLPRRQAAVVRLRVLEGLRFAEIAAVIGCPVATVKSRFRYALKKLRRSIQRNMEVTQ